MTTNTNQDSTDNAELDAILLKLAIQEKTNNTDDEKEEVWQEARTKLLAWRANHEQAVARQSVAAYITEFIGKWHDFGNVYVDRDGDSFTYYQERTAIDDLLKRDLHRLNSPASARKPSVVDSLSPTSPEQEKQ
jgi:hypothetical protein